MEISLRNIQLSKYHFLNFVPFQGLSHVCIVTTGQCISLLFYRHIDSRVLDALFNRSNLYLEVTYSNNLVLVLGVDERNTYQRLLVTSCLILFSCTISLLFAVFWHLWAKRIAIACDSCMNTLLGMVITIFVTY